MNKKIKIVYTEGKGGKQQIAVIDTKKSHPNRNDVLVAILVWAQKPENRNKVIWGRC